MKALTPRQLEAVKAVSLGRFLPSFVKEEDGWHAVWRGVDNDNPWIDDFVRSAAITPLSADAEEQRHETLHDAFLCALKSRTGLVIWDDAQCEEFARQLEAWSSSVLSAGSQRSNIVFVFSSDENGFRISCAVKRSASALRSLGQASSVFPPLRAMKSQGEAPDGSVNLSVAISRAEAESFMRAGARQLSDAGYKVEGCDITSTVTASADLVDAENDAAQSRRFQARLQVRVDGQLVGIEEIRFLLEQKSSLVFFRDRWIEVDRSILKEALRALERQDGRGLTLNEAVAFASGIGFAGRLAIEQGAAGGWLKGLVHRLKAAGKGVLKPVGRIDGFAGELRDYQARAVSWLEFLTGNGFGALLADDMGLGKTVQTIAWLVRTRESHPGPVLIVAPLTLLANWKRELAKFAPRFSVYVHHGCNRQLEYGLRLMADENDVVITSYNLFVKDYTAFRGIAWSALVLDEAQAVKNPDTRFARAAVSLGVARRVALTGTPVENSVADIWSIENILNPGFLGDRKNFTDRFVKPIAQNEKCGAAKKLSGALEPFVLRRLKSDPQIAGELGEKHEIKEYCMLSPQSRARYETALESYRTSEHTKGDMFALLTRLKLICDGAGKLERLAELLESIFSSGESALVFTQYAKVGEEIRRFLYRRFSRRFPFLHGALGSKARESEIEAFNSSKTPSAFVLSLKAGAYGLNLIKATHVIHFDRWWNPAAESQAADRAHRIGQKKTVFVHSFITEGTLEERIDAMLERKSRVAGTLIAGGEGFLKSISQEEFDAIVALDAHDGEG